MYTFNIFLRHIKINSIDLDIISVKKRGGAYWTMDRMFWSEFRIVCFELEHNAGERPTSVTRYGSEHTGASLNYQLHKTRPSRLNAKSARICLHIFLNIGMMTSICIIIYWLYHGNHGMVVMVNYLAVKFQVSRAGKKIIGRKNLVL